MVDRAVSRFVQVAEVWAPHARQSANASKRGRSNKRPAAALLSSPGAAGSQPQVVAALPFSLHGRNLGGCLMSPGLCRAVRPAAGGSPAAQRLRLAGSEERRQQWAAAGWARRRRAASCAAPA